MDIRVSTLRGAPIVEQFVSGTLEASLWEVSGSPTGLSTSEGKLKLHPANPSEVASIRSKRGCPTSGTFSFEEVVESSRTSGAGFLLVLEGQDTEGNDPASGSRIALGLNARPSTMSAMDSLDASNVICFNSSINGVWGIDELIVLEQDVVGQTVDYRIQVFEETVYFYVNEKLVHARQAPVPPMHQALYPKVVSIMKPSVPSSTSTLEIGQIEAFSYNSLRIEGGNMEAVKVASESVGKPTDPEASSNGGPFSLIALTKRLLTHLNSVISSLSGLTSDVRASYARLRADQTYIERWGAITVNSTSDVMFTNAASVPLGYTPQNIDYTVPSGKIFFLKGWRVSLDAPGNNVNIMIAIDVGGDKKVRMSLNTNSPSQEGTFNPPIPIPAGTVVKVWGHTSSGSTITFIRFAGIEENI